MPAGELVTPAPDALQVAAFGSETNPRPHGRGRDVAQAGAYAGVDLAKVGAGPLIPQYLEYCVGTSPGCRRCSATVPPLSSFMTLSQNV